jgi:phosphoenolpyruvate synthase/pyruvate phosphate dikinase
VGLARLEFIINNNIGVHPRAILDYPNIDADLKKAVEIGGPWPCLAAGFLC